MCSQVPFGPWPSEALAELNFPEHKYNLISINNNIDTDISPLILLNLFNSAILEACEKPVLGMFKHICCHLME